MPRINSPTKAGRIDTSTRALKSLSCVLKGHTNAPKIHESSLVDMKESTARKRLEKPEDITIGELIQICVAFDIPRDEALAKINW